ncbi:DUF4132 domain-containing protein [Glycomyces niveus]|uniref:DUF4132 domain-containing protein n=1 Tax=Glycomyces niveus TaxID=2820287 RepID=A0ABS3U3D7_9ACTN|nr:DUF4132 domain-containing protein [Glycomyces sp. NEAU-S30]MBO3733250.1 DUF4132 domain-containing protein [Glycomyces sp. NEAU-S30]
MANPLHPELPADWRPLLLPHRGRRPGDPVALDPEAPKRVKGLLNWYEPRLREALAKPSNHAFAAAGNAYLDGEADPRGAAAASAILAGSEKRQSSSMLRPELDAWVPAHGLPFAVCAAVQRMTMSAAGQYYRYRDEDIPATDLVEGRLAWHYYYGIGQDLADGVAAIRGLLAAAADDEYAAAVAAVAAHRGTPARRLAAAFLLPGERDWVAESCDEYRQFQTDGHRRPDPLLWLSADDPALLARAGLNALPADDCPPAVVAAIVDNLGPASLPVLTETLRRKPAEGARRTLLSAIASLPTDAAIGHLIGRLNEPLVAAAATASAERFPAPFLSAAARTKTSPRLTAIVRRIDAGILSATALADMQRVLDAAAPIPEADPATLPPLLTAPPWTVKRPKRKQVVIAGLTPPDAKRLEWSDGERAERESYRPFHREDTWRWRLEHHGGEYVLRYPAFYAEAPMELSRPLFEQWDGACGYTIGDELQQVLWRFGDEAIDRIAVALRTRTERHAALPPMFSAAAARLAADWLLRLKTARVSAIRWFERHGLDAVPMLVPDALGTDKKARQAAEAALVHLAARHGLDAVAEGAGVFGPEAATAIRELVDRDPLEPQGKLPSTDGLADPELLPQVLLRGGERALPAASLPHLVTVLSLTNPDLPYAGTEVVVDLFDPASLTRFSWALFELWIANGSQAKGNWTLTQLARFADDDTVRRLAPMIREWPGEGQHKRAVTGLAVLGAIGTETALRAIQGIADRVKFKGLKEEARRQIDAIAAELGLTRDQLADRLVPDFGLGEAGALVLDYGPRAFTVGFDEQLKPFVFDDAGKPRKSLPKPGAKDDPEAAEAAYRRFSLLRKDLRTVAADQVRRLEAAMVAARTWTPAEFRLCFAEHAFMAHLARRVLWLAVADGRQTAFRLAEDGTYSDAADDAIDLPEDAVIRLAHPLHLDEAALADWGQVFADYEILQPFPQLGRPVMEFTEDELGTGEVTRYDKVQVETGALLGLTARGWIRSHPEDAGVEPGLYFPLPGGGSLVMHVSEGFWAGALENMPPQTFELRWSTGEFHDTVDGAHAQSIMDSLDPVTASEILLTLDRLTGGRTTGS